jgi:PAS domain-containing protein
VLFVDPREEGRVNRIRTEEEAPKEGTEAFFHAAIDAIPLPIVVRDRNDDVVLGNKSWAELPPSAPNATSHTAYIKHPEGALDFTAYARLDRSVSISDVHGAERHFTEHTGRFTGPAAETFKVSVLFDVTDISREKERTETQLRLICDLVEALPLPLYAHDLNGRYIIINRAAKTSSTLTEKRS